MISWLDDEAGTLIGSATGSPYTCTPGHRQITSGFTNHPPMWVC